MKRRCMVVFSEHDKHSLLSSYFIVSQSVTSLNYHLCIQWFHSFIDKPCGTVHSVGGTSNLFHCLWKVHEIGLVLSKGEAERKKKEAWGLHGALFCWSATALNIFAMVHWWELWLLFQTSTLQCFHVHSLLATLLKHVGMSVPWAHRSQQMREISRIKVAQLRLLFTSSLAKYMQK